MISVSVIHGGPPPAFFTDAIAVVYNRIEPHIDSVVDLEIREKLIKVIIVKYLYRFNWHFPLQLQNAETLDEFKSLLSKDEYDFRFDCGISMAVNMVVESILLCQQWLYISLCLCIKPSWKK